jgi:hypothetical protein
LPLLPLPRMVKRSMNTYAIFQRERQGGSSLEAWK